MNERLNISIKEVSREINQTRSLLTTLERQRTWMVGVLRGQNPPLSYQWDPTKTPQWFREMVAETYRDKQPRLPGF